MKVLRYKLDALELTKIYSNNKKINRQQDNRHTLLENKICRLSLKL